MRSVTAALVVWLAVLPAAARAQNAASGVAVEGLAGVVSFADDGAARERVIGGAARVYLGPRVSIGPEITVVSGRNHDHQIVTGNIVYDFSLPAGSRITPYVVGGAGFFRTAERFPNRATFSATEGAFTAGGGVRVHLASRVFVAADARVGWEPHFRVSGTVGIRLRRY